MPDRDATLRAQWSDGEISREPRGPTLTDAGRYPAGIDPSASAACLASSGGIHGEYRSIAAAIRRSVANGCDVAPAGRRAARAGTRPDAATRPAADVGPGTR